MQSVLDSKTSEASEQLKALEEKINKVEEQLSTQAKLDNLTSNYNETSEQLKYWKKN